MSITANLSNKRDTFKSVSLCSTSHIMLCEPELIKMHDLFMNVCVNIKTLREFDKSNNIKIVVTALNYEVYT